MKLPRVTALTLAALILTGCASSTPTVEPTTEPDDDCLELSEDATAELQQGLDDKGAGYTIVDTAAIKGGDTWWVAANLDGDPAVTATWATVNDPTADGSNAYLSATELASLVSIFNMPDDLTGSDPVNAAEACLNQ